MHKKRSVFPTVFVFLLISFFTIAFFQNPVSRGIKGILEKTLIPIEGRLFHASRIVAQRDQRVKDLENENRILIKKIVDLAFLEKENKALRDQFETGSPKSSQLLPAHIIGASSFIPGINVPEIFIIDKGIKDSIKVGQGVVFQDNAVGKIKKVSEEISLVDLVTNTSMSLTAKSSQGVLGVVKGKGNGEIVFDNVLVSESIQTSDIIVTSGDVDMDGLGFPPNLVIGKLVSVNKKPSALFQNGNIKSLLDFSKLTLVFVLKI